MIEYVEENPNLIRVMCPYSLETKALMRKRKDEGWMITWLERAIS